MVYAEQSLDNARSHQLNQQAKSPFDPPTLLLLLTHSHLDLLALKKGQIRLDVLPCLGALDKRPDS